MTQAQARQAVVKLLREVRAVYRRADTQGERFERWIDRLIKERKKLVLADELIPAVEKLFLYTSLVRDLEKAMGATIKAVTRYEV
ncbi:hypothetical protein ES705_42933 [subsurface metagenome]